MLSTACPTRGHCHSGLVSLWQPQPSTQDCDCLKEKKDTTVMLKSSPNFSHSHASHCVPPTPGGFAFCEIGPWRALPPRGQMGPPTPLCGDDSDVVPLLLLAVQLHHRADEARVRGDAEQSLGVGLRINGVPGIWKEFMSKNKERT